MFFIQDSSIEDLKKPPILAKSTYIPKHQHKSAVHSYLEFPKTCMNEIYTKPIIYKCI